MISREELIEKMAKAIISAAEYLSTPEKQYLMFKNEQPYWNDVAEAALQAFLSNLPELKPSFLVPDMPIGYQFSDKSIWPAKAVHDENAGEYYQKLLKMKK